jgi:hypothetical protein
MRRSWKRRGAGFLEPLLQGAVLVVSCRIRCLRVVLDITASKG